MATIDKSYFFGELLLSGVQSTEGEAALQQVIDSREQELLIKLLGYELYKNYIAGIAVTPTPEAKWTDLRNGKEYTNSSGVLTKWPGLRFTVGVSKKSLIANYVYYHYLRDNYTFTTGSGEKKTALAVNSTPDAKLVRAWNEMIGWNYQLHDFLTVNIADYPQYENVQMECSLFTRQNILNL